MRLLLGLIVVLIMFLSMDACKSSSAPKTLCDTTCILDTIKFTGNHQLKPYLFISATGCMPQEFIWSYSGLGVNRKMGFVETLKSAPRINKNFIRVVFQDTSYIWVLFNDCESARGYQLKFPFNKSISIHRTSRGINNFDPKFAVADNLVATTDGGNLYVEDMLSGKKAMMTFGQALDIDYDAIHESIDSVNVSNNHIWANVKINGAWKALEKNITLE